MPDVTPRQLALEIIMAVARDGQPLDSVLPELYEAPFSPADKAFARQLLMQVLRHHGQLGALVGEHLQRPLEAKHASVDWLMRMGAAQLLLLKTPPHAAIDTSVQLCKTLGFVHQAGMVNAILRKLACDGAVLPPASYNLPSWIKGVWRKVYGREVVDAMADICLTEPPLDLTLRGELTLEGEALLPNHLRVGNQDIRQLSGYDTGDFWVQDMAASLPVRALGDVAGRKVVDICAAPGGKTLQLCAAGAQVSALDRSASRLEVLRQNLTRCRYQANVVRADAVDWQPQEGADIVLLDAPCSATGTVRRHPDIWLRKKESEIAEMVQLQRAILQRVMQWLPVGGVLLYAVCSLQPEEGEAQMQWLEQAYGQQLQPEPFAIENIPPVWQERPHFLRTLPHYFAEKGGMDGFFIAKWRRAR